MKKTISQGQKFYNMPMAERWEHLRRTAGLSPQEMQALSGQAGLTPEAADHMVENAVGVYGLPLGIAQHFLINGRDVQVPMAIEEPSVIAAASYMAHLARGGGGFIASADAPEMIGQMQILGVQNIEKARAALTAESAALLALAGEIDPLLKKLGGGARSLDTRVITESPIGAFLVLHLIMDVRDAMGANTINTALERLAPHVERITGGRVLLRILSNLADRRLARAQCTIPLSELAASEYSGEEVRDRIIEAWAFAAVDLYRAATHNKGIMNGVDAVVLATGNDWRAVEAGAHAYAARSGRYTSLSTWSRDAQGNLTGTLEMPMAVGIVGGATRAHPAAAAAIRLLGVKTAADLSQIIVSVGLAQNLGALRALATEGIQRGHMALHARQVALSAGAPNELVNPLAEQLIQEGRIHIERALEILQEWSIR